MTNKNQENYELKAIKCQQFADYYKYRNPNLHIYYYLKHIKNLNKARNNTYNFRRSLNIPPTAPAWYRLVHVTQKNPFIKIHVNGERTVHELLYKQANQYFSLSSGQHQLTIYPIGERELNFIHQSVTVDPGKYYTLVITEVSNSPVILAFEDRPDVPAGEAKIRFIHLCNNTSNLDIAVKNRDVIFPNLQPFESTNYLGINPMKLELEVRKTGTNEISRNLPPFTLEANQSYSVIMTDEDVILIS
ncbi:DUF4397 domain-containing protein [Bacillus sp. B15-48]|uniref:DUF4397 domain-containing protein n=1 Tax=Bacillus sp. B15-48 TaxID=1548601 RepID=UPI00193F9616|nr:DUF4397 domain-containing protein [Bacillus sp. B15-48]MBM4762031.1 DUF4397 domain-containing protein [Bacillus sp. B15-48]